MDVKFNYLSLINAKKTILICPLDWGLGHAARCVPIINECLRLNYKVIIGADKNPLAFLTQEFPELPTVVIPGYSITYDEKGSFSKLLYEGVQFNQFIKKEHQLIDNIVLDHKIDIIISDNRYGLWSKKVKSILITHQLFVKAPIGSSIAHRKIEKLIANFDDCWIPDFESSPNLSGDLSHLKPFKQPHHFIGPLSRFSSKQVVNSSVFEEGKNISKSQPIEEYDVIAIISGPEPQRTIFEDIILKQLSNSNLKAVIVRGLPSSTEKLKIENSKLKIHNHLKTKELFQYIQKSKIVLCRAGYSSIMDLAILGKPAILVPTPGQTEQEYLAKYHNEIGNFHSVPQGQFDVQKEIAKAQNCTTKFNDKLILNIDLSE